MDACIQHRMKRVKSWHDVTAVQLAVLMRLHDNPGLYLHQLHRRMRPLFHATKENNSVQTIAKTVSRFRERGLLEHRNIYKYQGRTHKPIYLTGLGKHVLRENLRIIFGVELELDEGANNG